MLFATTTIVAAGWTLWLIPLSITWIGLAYIYLRHIEHRQIQQLLIQKTEEFANRLMEDLQKDTLDDYASKN